MKPDPGVPAHDESRAGRTIGDFELERLLGRGGMGEVWLARQRSVGRQVALKLLPESMSENPRAVLRFRREAEAGGRLTHPNIATVYAAGLSDGRLYIAQELVSGSRSLADWIKDLPRDKPLEPGHFATVAHTVAQIAGALQFAHDQGVVHRDVKPQNILLTPDGMPKVVDFGLARVDDGFTVSESGEVAGTYAYMSPEQARARSGEVDHRTDVFSLGATLYELLTLERPFKGESVLELAERIAKEAPIHPAVIRPEIPEHMVTACLRAMEKRRENRFQSMADFANSLGGDIAQRQNLNKAQVSTHSRRTRMAWVFAGGGVAVAVTALSVWWPRPIPQTTVPAPSHSSGGLSFQSELERFARARIMEFEDSSRMPLPGDRLQERLRDTSVASVRVPAGTTLQSALDSIPALANLQILVQDPASDLALVNEVDLQFPTSADVVLDILIAETTSRIMWYANDQAVIICTSPEQGDLRLETYAICDLIPRPSALHGLRFKVQPEDCFSTMDPTEIASLVRQYIARDTWDSPPISIKAESQSDTLIINHTHRVHRLVQDLLAALRSCMILNECNDTLWDRLCPNLARAEADELLRLELSNRETRRPADRSARKALLSELEADLGCDIIPHDLPQDTNLGEWMLRADPKAVGTAAVPRSFGQMVKVPWTVTGGIVHIGFAEAASAMVIRPYPIADLFDSELVYDPDSDTASSFQSYTQGQIQQLICNHIDSSAWVSAPWYSLMIQEDLMIVSASIRMHRDIQDLLRKLRGRR